MALGWLRDAALHPALTRGEGISWGSPCWGGQSLGTGSEPGEHTSQCEGYACCRGEEHILCGSETPQQSF